MKTARTECLDHFVIFGERHLRYLLNQFVAHYHSERYHQGIGGRIIRPSPSTASDIAVRGTIHCHSRLGGQLRFYQRLAA
jgi:putative transposase